MTTLVEEEKQKVHIDSIIVHPLTSYQIDD